MKSSKGSLTRAHIIQEAASLFNTKGYAGTSMSDITKATGLSKGALYANFPDKEALALSAFRQAVRQVGKRTGAYTRKEKGAVAKLEALIAAYRIHVLDSEVRGGCPIQNMAVESDDEHPWLREEVIKALNTWRGNMVRTLERGKEEGDVRTDLDSERFALTFIGMLEDGILLARLYRDKTCFEPLAGQLLQLLQSAKAS